MGWHINNIVVYHTKFINFFFFLRRVFVLLSKQRANKQVKRNLIVGGVLKKKYVTPITTYRGVTQTTQLFYVLSMLLPCIFNNNKNVLFVCAEQNYNYLPISNVIIFSRSQKKLLKFFNYFDVGVVIFMGLKKSTYLHRILRKRNVVCVVVGTNNKNTDISFNLPNTANTKHVIYLLVLRFYLRSLL